MTSVEIVVERAPADWQNFAPEHLHPDTLVRRAGRHVLRPLRFLGHEWTLTVLGGLALSVLLNYAALRDMMHTLPKDVGDPSLVAYLMAWDGFALLHRPADLWQTNAFFPGTYTLGYTDAFLGYAPFALIGTGIAAAVLRYNIVFILAQALAFIGAYALVRQLGAVRVAAAAAAVAFAVAPWRLGAAGHLQVLSTGGIALSLAMLARAHGVRWRTAPARSSGESRPPVRPGWAAAGWLCAAWQITIGFAVGLVFAYVLAGAAVVGLIWWLARSRRMPSWWLLAVDGIGAIVFAAVCFLLARPYGKVVDLYPSAARTDDWIAQHSTPLRGFFTAPESSLVWGDVHAPSRALLSMPNDMALLPGFALLAFAVAGIAFSVWRWPVRLLLALGVVATAALAMGTHGPDGGKAGYLFLLHNVPGFDGLPTPGYLIIWTTLLLAVLAAGSVAALAARSGEVALRLGLPRPTAMARFALLLPFILVLAEGIGTTPQVKVPPVPAAVARADAPLLVLPSTDNLDKLVMLWTTTSFEDVVNGGSGFVPTELANARDQVKQFPDPGSVDYLRGLGVKTVVVLPDLAKGTPWEASATAEIDDLGISRDVASDAITFHLDS